MQAVKISVEIFWGLILVLIFVRPFLVRQLAPSLEHIHSFFLLAIIFLFRILKKDKYKVELPFVFLLISALVVFFIKPTNPLSLFYFLLPISICSLIINVSSKHANQLIDAFIASAAVISIYAIYQYFFGLEYTLNYLSRQSLNYAFAEDFLGRGRVFAPFILPNLLASFLIMSIPVVISKIKQAFDRKLFLVLNFMLAVQLSALILTRSIAGIFSLIIALGIYFFIVGFSKKTTYLFACLFLMFSVAFFMRNFNLPEHLTALFSVKQRMLYWKQTVDTIKQSPFVGVGLGNFSLYRSRFAHNSFLQLWAESGVVVLIAFILVVIKRFKAGILKLKNKDQYIKSAGLIASCSAFLIHNIFDFSFSIPQVSLLFWILLSLL